jgi:hypothetical protein
MKMYPRGFLINCCPLLSKNGLTYPGQIIPVQSGSDPSAVTAEEFGLLFLVNAVDLRQCQLGSQLHLLCLRTKIFTEKGLQLVLKIMREIGRSPLKKGIAKLTVVLLSATVVI